MSSSNLHVLAATTKAQEVALVEHRLPIDRRDGPYAITVGPDGALWFNVPCGTVARITTAGVITEYPVGAGPAGITAGPDGALWFAVPYNNSISRLTVGLPLLAVCKVRPSRS